MVPISNQIYNRMQMHLSNYTKTITATSSVKIDEYSPQLHLKDYSTVFTKREANKCLLFEYTKRE